MKYEGRVFLKNRRVCIDAEPYVMSKIRALFGSAISGGKGNYTHNYLSLPVTMGVLRDVDWVMSRYVFECEDKLLSKIRGESKKHDDLLQDIGAAHSDTEFRATKESVVMTKTPRDHQVVFNNLCKKVNRVLLADKMGVGKTISALTMLVESNQRPAIIVTPPTICTQWEVVIKEVLPTLKTHVIYGFKNYELPEEVDVIITSYNRINKWQDTLVPKTFKTMIMDEVHNLRHTGTKKRETAKALSEKVETCIGLSGTPIFNYGEEIWSVMDVISPSCLGDRYDFIKEWSGFDGKIKEPKSLNSYLKNQGLMLRRSAKDVGLDFDSISKEIITIDSDLDELKKVQNIAKKLAVSVLSGNISEQSMSAREFDIKLRMATGVAKAKAVAEFAKMILEEKEKVIIAAWHRDVWGILEKELKKYRPAWFTGTENTNQKDKSVDSFINGDSRILFMSLRSAEGRDGLQKVCDTIIHAEFDWTPHVHDQLNTRIDRDGQENPTTAYYLKVNDGSDPVLSRIAQGKRDQHDGLVDGKEAQTEIVMTGAHKDRVKDMAKEYLESIGEEIPEAVEETGLTKEISDLIRSLRIPMNSEDEMQRGLDNVLKENLLDCEVHREYVVSKRSRLDFLITRGEEKVAIECKKDAKKRMEVYKQVRRYKEEIDVDSVILVAPWSSISSFVIDETPVVVIDPSEKAI